MLDVEVEKIFTDCSLYSDTTNIIIGVDSSYLPPFSSPKDSKWGVYM